MIFVTVGTQLPFDRLVTAVDDWAATARERVFIQCGAGGFIPRHCDWLRQIRPAEWQARFDSADLVVSHAGMGTILQCMRFRKPLIVMPRRADLGEHRNDHQLASAARFGTCAGIRVANESDTLHRLLDEEVQGVASEAKMAPARTREPLDRLLSELARFVGAAR